MYRLAHGDKDTFRLAFALAGDHDKYEQVAVGPSFILSNDSLKARRAL